MPVTAQDLIEGRPSPTTVKLQDPLVAALDLMLQNDFTTLPVVDETNKVLGVVTVNAILRIVRFLTTELRSLSVQSAYINVKKIRLFRLDDELSQLLEGLLSQPSIVIADNEDRLAGILTSWDTTEFFRRQAEDMMLVEDIESAIIDHITAAFTEAASGDIDHGKLREAILEVSSNRDRAIASKAIKMYFSLASLKGKPDKEILEHVFEEVLEKIGGNTTNTASLDDLSLGERIQLLLHDSVWDDYQSTFPVSKAELSNMLDRVRQTRNNLAHFRREITSEERELLKLCSDWLLVKHPPRKVNLPIRTTPAPDISNEIVPLDEEFSPKESRYAKLALYLKRQPANIDSLTLTFEQIEQIIETDLPPSARAHRAWWANDSVAHLQSKEWLEAGWRRTALNITEGRVTFARIREREAQYIDFFTKLVDNLRKQASFKLRDLNPTGQSWNIVATLPRKGNGQLALLGFSFAKGNKFRVELYIDTGDKERNKQIFDRLFTQRGEIERDMGAELQWERLPTRRASRIAIYQDGSIENSPEKLDELRHWAVEAMIRFENAITTKAEEAIREIYK